MFIEIDTIKYTFDSEGVVWGGGIPICYKHSTPKESVLKSIYVFYFA